VLELQMLKHSRTRVVAPERPSAQTLVFSISFSTHHDQAIAL
jgi:hypothetical protein